MCFPMEIPNIIMPNLQLMLLFVWTMHGYLSQVINVERHLGKVNEINSIEIYIKERYLRNCTGSKTFL